MEEVTKKEHKKLTKMVKTMRSMSKKNFIGAPQADIINALTGVLRSLAGVNAYVSAYDEGYEGFLSDEGIVSFAWPLDMDAFDEGFRWFVPLDWNTVSKKQNIYIWAYREVYQAANELFLKRLPTLDSNDWLRTAFVRNGKMSTHEFTSVAGKYKYVDIAVVYRKSKKDASVEEND